MVSTDKNEKVQRWLHKAQQKGSAGSSSLVEAAYREYMDEW